MSDVLGISGLRKRFGDFELDIPELRVEAGTVMGLVGANGAGKSTTLKLILNLLHRDEGTIQVMGMDNRREDAAIKQEIGVVFDEPCFHDLLTPAQIGRSMRPWYAKWDDDLYRRYLHQFELPSDKRVKEFSRGMKMKLSIATAMCHRPHLLLLDEPTSSLDIQNQYQVLQIVRDICHEQHLTAIVVIHDLNLALRFCDRFVLLRQGGVYACGGKEVLDRDALRDVYHVDAEVVAVQKQSIVLVDEKDATRS